MTPIQVTNLCKSYGDKLVLNNISFTLAPAETVCIMGQSGQGKTTLLHILMGLASYDSGQISGIPFHKSAVFQENRLCESFSVLRNISMVCPKSVTQQ